MATSKIKIVEDETLRRYRFVMSGYDELPNTFDTKETAKIVGLSSETLENDRRRDRKYNLKPTKIGARVVYLKNAIAEFLVEKHFGDTAGGAE